MVKPNPRYSKINTEDVVVMLSPRITRSQTRRLSQHSKSSSVVFSSSSVQSSAVSKSKKSKLGPQPPSVLSSSSSASSVLSKSKKSKLATQLPAVLSSSSSKSSVLSKSKKSKPASKLSALVEPDLLNCTPDLHRFVENEIRSHMMKKKIGSPQPLDSGKSSSSVEGVSMARGSKFKVAHEKPSAKTAEEFTLKRNLQTIADSMKSPSPTLVPSSPATANSSHLRMKPARDAIESLARRPSNSKRTGLGLGGYKAGPASKKARNKKLLIGKLKYVSKSESNSSTTSGSD